MNCTRIALMVTTVFFVGIVNAGHHKSNESNAVSSVAPLSKEQKIKLAKAAAPSNISDEARILDADNTVLKEAIMADRMVDTANLRKPSVDAGLNWLDAYMNKPYINEAKSIVFLICWWATFPLTMMIRLIQTKAKTHGFKRGPHLMLLVPQGLFGNSTDPFAGGPYVWEGSIRT